MFSCYFLHTVKLYQCSLNTALLWVIYFGHFFFFSFNSFWTYLDMLSLRMNSLHWWCNGFGGFMWHSDYLHMAIIIKVLYMLHFFFSIDRNAIAPNCYLLELFLNSIKVNKMICVIVFVFWKAGVFVSYGCSLKHWVCSPWLNNLTKGIFPFFTFALPM